MSCRVESKHCADDKKLSLKSCIVQSLCCFLKCWKQLCLKDLSVDLLYDLFLASMLLPQADKREERRPNSASGSIGGARERSVKFK